MKKRVAISILNYNGAQSTLECVRSLLAAEQFGGGCCLVEILVADNASDEQDRASLQQSLAGLPKVSLRLNSENFGFAAGHNRNLAVIFHQSSPDYVWILNNDCLVHKETLSALIQSAERHTDVGIWGATLIEPDGETIQCAGGCLYSPWVSAYRPHGRNKQLAAVRRLAPVDFDYIAGASLFFPIDTIQNGLRTVPTLTLPDRNTTERQQWLNETFFLYFEELDLAQRLKSGNRMAWCKKALITHAGGMSTGGAKTQKSSLAEYHSTLSALKFTRLYYPRRLWFMAPARFISNFLLIIFRRELRLIASMTSAYRAFLTMNLERK